MLNNFQTVCELDHLQEIDTTLLNMQNQFMDIHPLADIVELVPVMGSLETVSRQYFHCLGLGLDLKGYCLGLGLEATVLVSCLVEIFIKTIGRNVNCIHANLSKFVI